MAKLYYYYGAMGSSKTANALMTRFNYEEAGQKALLCKPKLDTRDGAAVVRSRIGLCETCVFLEDLITYTEDQIRQYQCIVVDEVQFATKEQVDFLSDIVDSMDVPVVCYGLRADFQNRLFPGSERLIAVADCAGAEKRRPAMPDTTKTALSGKGRRSCWEAMTGIRLFAESILNWECLDRIFRECLAIRRPIRYNWEQIDA